jgi:hypothetical protein
LLTYLIYFIDLMVRRLATGTQTVFQAPHTQWPACYLTSPSPNVTIVCPFTCLCTHISCNTVIDDIRNLQYGCVANLQSTYLLESRLLEMFSGT